MALRQKLPRTLGDTYSLYVPGGQADRLKTSALLADAVVASGPAGPRTVRSLRNAGWQGIALFDRAAYLDPSMPLDVEKWFEEQRQAEADRLLTPSRFVSSEVGHLSFDDQIETEVLLATESDATCVIAIDYRWLTKSAQHDEMLRSLCALACPVALVLADRGDPLGHLGAVDALVAVIRRVSQLSLLRIDHAGVGALAFDAAHASIGLSTMLRHAVPPTTTAQAIPHDRTARVFLIDLMDSFTGATIAGWSTTWIVLQATSSRSGSRLRATRRRIWWALQWQPSRWRR